MFGARFSIVDDHLSRFNLYGGRDSEVSFLFEGVWNIGSVSYMGMGQLTIIYLSLWLWVRLVYRLPGVSASGIVASVRTMCHFYNG